MRLTEIGTFCQKRQRTTFYSLCFAECCFGAPLLLSTFSDYIAVQSAKGRIVPAVSKKI